MKPNFIDRAIGYFSPDAGLRRVRARMQTKRISDVLNKYDAAGTGRRNLLWNGADTSSNAEIGVALPMLRGRSRELVRNNAYAAKALEVIVSNVVGDGIVPVAKSTNKRKKELADALMREWMQHCDAHGRLHFYALQSLMMRAESEGGEALVIRQVTGDRSVRVPLRLKLREGDYLDHLKSEENREGGGYIRQGVEFNSLGEIVGYWMFNVHPGDRSGVSLSSKFVSAESVAHLYEMRRPEQVRGIPRGVSGFQRIKLLDDFQDARLEQQKVAACFVGVIRDNENDTNAGDVLPDKLEPGMFPSIGYGKDVSFNSPPSVSGHAEFVNTEQRAIAAAYGITYEALTGDLSNTNFSAGRMGWIEFSRMVEHWRWNVLIPTLKKIERWFVEAAELAGYDLSGVEFEWTPPRREMIDPTKEIPAQIKAIRSGLKSWQETVRENGYDPLTVLQELEDDNTMFDERGLTLDSDPRKVTLSGQFQIDSQNSTPDEG